MRSKISQKNSLLFENHIPPVDKINEIITKENSFFVLSHIDPDGDSLGSQLAFAAYLKSLGKTVHMLRDSDIPEKYQFLEGVLDIPRAEDLEETLTADVAVILECPNYKRIGTGSKFFTEETYLINIDHHQDNDKYGNLNWFNVRASSVGEMLFEFFEKVGYDIPRTVAEYLYVAIMTDTGRFRYRSTSGRTMEIAGKLLDKGLDPQKLCDLVYFDMKPSTTKLVGKVLNNIEFHHDGRTCLLTMDNKMLSESGADYSESDGLVDYTLFNRGVVVGLFIKEVEKNVVKVSMRSKNGMNVAAIAAEFGGGGHFNASGCTLEMSLDEVKELMLRKVKDGFSKTV